MAVLSCKITDSVTGADEQEKKGYKEDFNVMVEDGDQPATIINSNHADVPKVGDSHPIDRQATVKSRSVKGTDNRNLWILSVNYEYATGEEADNSGGGGGGGMQLVELSGGAWQEDYILEQDQDGKAVRNTAGDPFEKSSFRTHPLINITARSRDFMVDRYIYKVGSTNSNSWSIVGLTFPKETLLFDDFSFKNLDGGWWEYNFTLKARMVSKPVEYDGNQTLQEGENRSAGWAAYILDAGYRELDDNDALIPIRPKDSNDKKTSAPVSSPWPLDGSGKALKREDFKKANWIRFKELPTTGFWIFRFNLDGLFTPDALKGLY